MHYAQIEMFGENLFYDRERIITNHLYTAGDRQVCFFIKKKRLARTKPRNRNEESNTSNELELLHSLKVTNIYALPRWTFKKSNTLCKRILFCIPDNNDLDL